MTDLKSMKDILIEHHKEEKADCEFYHRLAEEAYQLGLECASGVLNDIADEEKTHALMIEHILDKEVFK